MQFSALYFSADILITVSCLGALLEQNTNYVILENEILELIPTDVIILDGPLRSASPHTLALPPSPHTPPLPSPLLKIVQSEIRELKSAWLGPAKGKGIGRVRMFRRAITRRAKVAFGIVIQEVNINYDPDPKNPRRPRRKRKCEDEAPAAPQSKKAAGWPKGKSMFLFND